MRGERDEKKGKEKLGGMCITGGDRFHKANAAVWGKLNGS